MAPFLTALPIASHSLSSSHITFHVIYHTCQHHSECLVVILNAKLCPTLATAWAAAPRPLCHVILQARILECAAVSFSRGSSLPRGGS